MLDVSCSGTIRAIPSDEGSAPSESRSGALPRSGTGLVLWSGPGSQGHWTGIPQLQVAARAGCLAAWSHCFPHHVTCLREVLQPDLLCYIDMHIGINPESRRVSTHLVGRPGPFLRPPYQKYPAENSLGQQHTRNW